MNAGLQLVKAEDGQTSVREAGGHRAWFVTPFRSGGSSYVYFRADDSFKWPDTMALQLTVEYFDAAPGELSIEFDGSDLAAPFNGAYSRSRKIKLAGDHAWKTAYFDLTDARLLGSQNAGADFRINATAREIAIGSVSLSRP